MKNKLNYIITRKEIYLPGILLILTSLPFYFWDIDIIVSGWFYDPTLKQVWMLKKTAPWNIFYQYGTWPAIGISIAGLLIFIFGFFSTKIAYFKKTGLYLAAVMLIGPGIIVNTIFKDNFGRPRPRNIEPFGGEQKYHQLWEADWGNKGRAFPCGHCSTAFYFFVFYFLSKKFKRRWLAYSGAGIGIGYGILMGITRIGQGGHFVSDVLWSAGFVYLTAGILYFAFFFENE